MMNTLKINIDDILDKDVREIVNIIDKVANSLNLDFYIIGARARDFWFQSVNISPKRFTLDIDFAILVPEEYIFEEFKSILISKHEFIEVKSVPHRLKNGDIIVDLLPFGNIANYEYVTFNDSQSTRISIIGFNEVYNQITADGIVENEMKIASLPGLCVLKLIAFDDRPEARRKDIEDIASILKNYQYFVSDELYDNHQDLIDDDFEMEMASVRILGRHIGKIIKDNTKLIDRILRIISIDEVRIEEYKILQILSQQLDISLTDSLNQILALNDGINDIME